MQILKPENASAAYTAAAEAFREMYEQVTGIRLAITTSPQDDDLDDLVVIGSDAVNGFARRAFLEGWAPQCTVPPGSDSYAAVSVHRNGRDILFLWGGRGRSTLYAVYAFFEKQAGCRYFWDGDIIPHKKELPIKDTEIYAKPDFAIRGLRYFAHRGLHRFQAEHWGLADWKREIDWMLKRGLNLFMLRLGSDDLFQQAFPEAVEYPPASGNLPEAGAGYDNRTLFWPLQYRGWLQKKVLQYAFERDLLEPEDCGTITHWYTRTPYQFLEKYQPDFMPQTTDVYRQPTGLVWDIRKDENMDRYFRLTKTHAQQYGQPRLFHTIGLAERMCSDDRSENMRYKKMAYHRILSRVEEEWPGAPVLIASWDFAMHWMPHEVQELLKELDPVRHVILDYTADTSDRENNFETWGFRGNYPWIFGIFHAFEPNSELRGDYPELAKRLAVARTDPMCKGLVFWPELSHSDTLMLEYFVRSGWEQVQPETFIGEFCTARYGENEEMLRAWKAVEPLLPMHVWTLDRTAAIEDIHQEYFFDVLGYAPLRSWPKEKLEHWKTQTENAPNVLTQCALVLHTLACVKNGGQDAFIRRDCADLARTALGRALQMLLLQQICDASQGVWSEEICGLYKELLLVLCGVLDSHEDYSQYDTLQRLEAECPVNRDFETALKQNLANGYCRGYAAEFMRLLCTEENEAYLAWLKESAAQKKACADEKLMKEKERLYQEYMKKPLREMAHSRCAGTVQDLVRGAQLMRKAAEKIKSGQHPAAK